MAAILQPWQIFVASLAGWITRQQDAVVEYLREENRVLKQQLGHRRLRLTDDQFYVFFVIELETRKIEIGGITPGPNEAWMMQIGRSLTDPIDGFLVEKRYLILDRRIFFGERSLRKATCEFAGHYHRERNHQGLDNRLIEPDARETQTCGPVECIQRLGGMLRFYRCAAA